jgi:hypothetical protein
MQFGPTGYQVRGYAMSSIEQQDERRILGQMVRFQNQAAVRIDNDCVNGLGGTSPHSQGQDKENKALFHVPLFHTVVEPAQRRAVMDSVLPVKATGFKEPCGSYGHIAGRARSIDNDVINYA